MLTYCITVTARKYIKGLFLLIVPESHPDCIHMSIPLLLVILFHISFSLVTSHFFPLSFSHLLSLQSFFSLPSMFLLLSLSCHQLATAGVGDVSVNLTITASVSVAIHTQFFVSKIRLDPLRGLMCCSGVAYGLVHSCSKVRYKQVVTIVKVPVLFYLRNICGTKKIT